MTTITKKFRAGEKAKELCPRCQGPLFFKALDIRNSRGQITFKGALIRACKPCGRLVLM